MERSKVYFTKNLTSESLIKIYESLGVKLTGNVGVKVSTGEKSVALSIQILKRKFLIYSSDSDK